MNYPLRYVFVRSMFAKIVNGRIVQIALPAISGAYFLTLDVWGADLKFISRNIDEHKILFAFLLVVTLLSQLFHAIAGIIGDKFQSSYTGFLEDFMLLTGRIVDFKQARFRKILPGLSKKGDSFQKITQPDDQIDFIGEQSMVWLRSAFELTERQLSITIIQIRHGGSLCFYAYKYPNGWQRTRAKEIMTSETAAARCAANGEPLFYPDKKRAEKLGQYIPSERDVDRGNGSIYCYPVDCEAPGGIEKFVISVTSYGKLLCSPNDSESAEIAQAILREMCRRLELELTLKALRQWKYGEK